LKSHSQPMAVQEKSLKLHCRFVTELGS